VSLPAAARLPAGRSSVGRWRTRLAVVAQRGSALAVAASIVGGFVVWELVAQLVIRDKLFLVPPTAIVARFFALWSSNGIQPHIATSGLEFVLGFAAAGVVGVLVGLLLGTNTVARSALTPWVSAIYSTPTVALAPLLILWFGLGLFSKIVVVFLVAVFPVLVNTQVGIEGADQRLIETARAFGANGRQIFTKVLLPSAVPFIVAGLRLGVGRGLVGIVVAELFGARAGLGYFINISSQIFDMGGLFVAVILLAGAGVLTTEALRIVERRIAPWRWV
jgi:ABC-type nitrate/sulfonate/bicarbonate transport system permease component